MAEIRSQANLHASPAVMAALCVISSAGWRLSMEAGHLHRQSGGKASSLKMRIQHEAAH